MRIFAFLISLALSSSLFAAAADAQSRNACRSKCGYIAHPESPNEGKASQTPAVNACYRKCMKRTPK
jgi:hypothetical protein